MLQTLQVRCVAGQWIEAQVLDWLMVPLLRVGDWGLTHLRIGSAPLKGHIRQLAIHVHAATQWFRLNTCPIVQCQHLLLQYGFHWGGSLRTDAILKLVIIVSHVFPKQCGHTWFLRYVS